MTGFTLLPRPVFANVSTSRTNYPPHFCLPFLRLLLPPPPAHSLRVATTTTRSHRRSEPCRNQSPVDQAPSHLQAPALLVTVWLRRQASPHTSTSPRHARGDATTTTLLPEQQRHQWYRGVPPRPHRPRVSLCHGSSRRAPTTAFTLSGGGRWRRQVWAGHLAHLRSRPSRQCHSGQQAVLVAWAAMEEEEEEG